MKVAKKLSVGEKELYLRRLGRNDFDWAETTFKLGRNYCEFKRNDSALGLNYSEMGRNKGNTSLAINYIDSI